MTVVVATVVPDLHLPRIGWRSISGTITASGEAEGFEATLAADPATYTAWMPDALPATWELDAGALVAADYCAIGAHNLGTVGATVQVQAFFGAIGDWVTIAQESPEDDSAILFLFVVPNRQRWRLVITGPTPPRIGNIRFGVATKLPRRSTFAPALPISEAERLEYQSNVSATGEWLGRSVVSAGLEFTVAVEHMPEDFAADEWADFRRHANEGDGTFYIAPKPEDYPDEVAYAWPLEPVRAERSIPVAGIARATEIRCGGYRRP